jgi:hypothetical protein
MTLLFLGSFRFHPLTIQPDFPPPLFTDQKTRENKGEDARPGEAINSSRVGIVKVVYSCWGSHSRSLHILIQRHLICCPIVTTPGTAVCTYGMHSARMAGGRYRLYVRSMHGDAFSPIPVALKSAKRGRRHMIAFCCARWFGLDMVMA